MLTTGNLNLPLFTIGKSENARNQNFGGHFFSEEQVVEHLSAYSWVRGKKDFGVITSICFYTGWWLNMFSLSSWTLNSHTFLCSLVYVWYHTTKTIKAKYISLSNFMLLDFMFKSLTFLKCILVIRVKYEI